MGTRSDNNDSDDETVEPTPPFDLLVIGGGVVGLAILRQAVVLGYQRCCLVEQEPHLLHWASGSNSGIACTGVDAAVGSLERALIRDSIAQLRGYCHDMNVPLRECGSIVLSSNDSEDVSTGGDKDHRLLQQVLEESHVAGDTAASLWTPQQIAEQEPYLNPRRIGRHGGVHIPGEIVLDSWLYSISLAVQARELGRQQAVEGTTIDRKNNRCQFFTNFEMDPSASTFDDTRKLWTIVRKQKKDEQLSGHTLPPPNSLTARAVVNATGLWADDIQQQTYHIAAAAAAAMDPTVSPTTTNPCPFRSKPRRGQYRVFGVVVNNNQSSFSSSPLLLTHPIQPIPTQRTKGIFLFFDII